LEEELLRKKGGSKAPASSLPSVASLPKNSCFFSFEEPKGEKGKLRSMYFPSGKGRSKDYAVVRKIKTSYLAKVAAFAITSFKFPTNLFFTNGGKTHLNLLLIKIILVTKHEIRQFPFTA